jgi:crossover junction endodeoxyribonuclease RuvC
LLTLGIDPGTAIMGYGLVASDGGSLHAIDYGALTTPSDLRPEERLRRLHERLCEIIAAHRPDAMAVEELFFNANARTAIAVGQARGVALLAAAQAGLRVHEYTPLQVKGAVAGYGRAGKEQVQLMAATLLALRTVPRPDDAADALAVAICHAHSARLVGLVGP